MAEVPAAGEGTRRGDELQHLCGEMASIFRRAWGRGPVRTTARWAGRDMIVVLMENGHNDAEKTLRAAGHIQQLLGGRELLQTIIEGELKAAVELIFGRRVQALLSATRLDPDLSAEVFVLEPLGDDGDSSSDEVNAGR